MKPYKESLVYGSNILVVKEEYITINDFPFHYHTEYELILILKGSGKRYVGDSVDDFNSGDLCFLGPNLPHTYSNKHLTTNREMHQIVIQFSEDFLGKGFFDAAPFRFIKSLFNRSVQGYHFTGETLKIVVAKMMEMVRLSETEAIIQLLLILDILSKSNEYRFLVSPGFSKKTDDGESERMSRVFNYIFENFNDEISLNEVASIACLSPEAFCRYFKKYTRKTLSQFLNELRIGHACRLLQENNMPLAQISNQCGFNSISYFNRRFKSLYHTTPLEYQRTHSIAQS